MDRKNINQGGKHMTCTEQKPEAIVFEPKVSRDNGETFDIAAAGLQFESRISRVSTDVLIDLDVMKYNGRMHTDVINVSGLLDVVEQAERIINRGIYNTMALQPSYCGPIRNSRGGVAIVEIKENENNQYSIIY